MNDIFKPGTLERVETILIQSVFTMLADVIDELKEVFNTPTVTSTCKTCGPVVTS